MKNKSVVLVVVLSIIIIVILFLTKIINTKVIDITSYEIDYYSNNNVLYIIETKRDNIKVTSKAIIQCIQEPCEPIFIESFNVEYKDEYKEFFKEIFQNREENKIIITNNELNEENKKVLFDMLGMITYDLLGSSYYDSKYATRGYYLEKTDDNKYLLTVSMGEKNTGGYDISIYNVSIANTITVYTSEENPSFENGVIESITYPVTQIKFSKKPKNIKVMDITSSEEFVKIDIN